MILMAVTCVTMLNVLAFKANDIKLVEGRPYSLRQKCSPKNIFFWQNVSYAELLILKETTYCINERHPLSKAII